MTTQMPKPTMDLILAVEFKPFTELDWQAYAGCESEEPQIGYLEASDGTFYCVVIDGNRVQVEHYNQAGEELEPVRMEELS